MQATGLALHPLALHACRYLHLPMIAASSSSPSASDALGHVGEPLETVRQMASAASSPVVLRRIVFLLR